MNASGESAPALEGDPAASSPGPPSQRPMIRVKKKKKRRRSKWWRLLPVLVAAFLVHVFYMEATHVPEKIDDSHLYEWDFTGGPPILDLALFRSAQKYGVTVEIDEQFARQELGIDSMAADSAALSETGFEKLSPARPAAGGETPAAEGPGDGLPLTRDRIDAVTGMVLSGDYKDAARAVLSSPAPGAEGPPQTVAERAGYSEEELVARLESALRRAISGRPVGDVRAELERLMADEKIVALGRALGLDPRELAHVLTEYLMLSSSHGAPPQSKENEPKEILPEQAEKGSRYAPREIRPIELVPIEQKPRSAK